MVSAMEILRGEAVVIASGFCLVLALVWFFSGSLRTGVSAATFIVGLGALLAAPLVWMQLPSKGDEQRAAELRAMNCMVAWRGHAPARWVADGCFVFQDGKWKPARDVVDAQYLAALQARASLLLYRAKMMALQDSAEDLRARTRAGSPN